jgi:hypothetical protein
MMNFGESEARIVEFHSLRTVSLRIAASRRRVSRMVYLVAHVGAQQRYWVETKTETIWRGRYTNCDKDWAVDLPIGVVAHASLPPSPNHRFLISAAEPGTAAEVTFDGQRIIDFYDEYVFVANTPLDRKINGLGGPSLASPFSRRSVLQT